MIFLDDTAEPSHYYFSLMPDADTPLLITVFQFSILRHDDTDAIDFSFERHYAMPMPLP
jgi:hypothetical protein